MAWKAALITDYQLHRRRLFMACIGMVAALAMAAAFIVGAVSTLERRDIATGAFGIVMLLYFGRMAFREWAGMKTASR